MCCDYCESIDKVNLEDFEANEDSGITKLDIVFYPKIRNIAVEVTTVENGFMNFGIDERINYCPYCGKKLEIYKLSNSE